MITRTNTDNDPNNLAGVQVGGSFRIERLLGVGGMGQVWLARAEELDGKEAAVKVLLREIGNNPEHLRRFKIEVRVVGGLRDNNVVEIWDAGRLPDGRHYMIMEFCAGGSLASLLASKGTLSIDEAFMYLAGPLSALAAAHAANVIHRDFKPDNVLLVMEDGRVRAKLGDFGIAKLDFERIDAQYRTGTMKIVGTPGYMAPEQLDPKHRLDARADVYAFGCVLYQCLTGRLPYEPTNLFQYIEAVASRRSFPRPSMLRAGIPPALDDLVMSCLEHDRQKRIQTVEGVMARFAEAVPNGETLMRFFAPRFVPRSTSPKANTISESIGVAATEFVSAMSASTEQARRRAIRRAAAAFVAGLAIGGGAVALATQSRGRSVEATAIAPSSIPVDAAVIAHAPVAPVDAAVAMHAAAPSPVDAAVIAPADAAVPVAGGPVVRVRGEPGAGPRAAAPSGAPERSPASSGAPTRSPTPTGTAKPERTAPRGEGVLHIEVEPWADVQIGDWQDTAPVTRKFPAGRYRVVLKNKTRTESIDVTITPNQTTNITRSW